MYVQAELAIHTELKAKGQNMSQVYEDDYNDVIIS